MEHNIGAKLYHMLYPKSNFFSKPADTQRFFTQVAKEFLEENKKNDQRS